MCLVQTCLRLKQTNLGCMHLWAFFVFVFIFSKIKRTIASVTHKKSHSRILVKRYNMLKLPFLLQYLKFRVSCGILQVPAKSSRSAACLLLKACLLNRSFFFRPLLCAFRGNRYSGLTWESSIQGNHFHRELTFLRLIFLGNVASTPLSYNTHL